MSEPRESSSLDSEPRDAAHHAGPSPEVRMLNDIAMQFRYQPVERAAAEIALHIRRFWDPRMRDRLRRAVESESDSMDPLALAAADELEK